MITTGALFQSTGAPSSVSQSESVPSAMKSKASGLMAGSSASQSRPP
ncbi:MAG: hypothetical protein ACK559_26555 [bacterium]